MSSKTVFKGYGFTRVFVLLLMKVVHGIPGLRQLKLIDIISDIGATLNGYVGMRPLLYGRRN